MDKETLEKLGGMVTEVSTTVKRSAWGDSSSESHEYGASAVVATDADPVVVVKGLEEMLEGLFDLSGVVTREDVGAPAGGDTAESGEEEIIRAVFAEEPDEKFRLELYGNFGGKPSKWPVLKMVANRDAMHRMLKPVFDDIGKPPADKTVNWVAAWKQGREKPNKPGEYYKDLQSVRSA